MPFTLAGHTIVQARFGRADPGDTVINTFVFQDGTGADPLAQIRARLDTFYTALSGTQTATIRSYMADTLVSLIYYMRPADAAVGVPGEELGSLAWTTPTATNRLPDDVAVCLSYRSDPPNTARRRGRIYLGPLNTNGLGPDGEVTLALQTNLARAGAQLADDSVAGEPQWRIASRVGNAAADITNGYVDNEFDTQRRRGRETDLAARVTWSDPF